MPPSAATATVDTDRSPASLKSRFIGVRSTTERLAAPLSPEDQVVQSMPDASPTKWHRAHVTWFFETFILAPHLAGYEADPTFGFLFNSYYEAVGERHPRPKRGLITRPSVAEVADYRAKVDEAMVRLLESPAAERADVAELVVLGLHHEQQHQELLLMDVKHMLSSTVVRSGYRDRPAAEPGTNPAWDWVAHDGGIVEIGHDGDGFHFDNEGPRHQQLIQPFRLADRAVTAGDWMEFMADGGYETAALWLMAGWQHISEAGWQAPEYWRRDDSGSWLVYTLDGERLVDTAEPVVHVSYYEADAFARWAGARLPTETEWEAVAASVPVDGNLLPSDHLHPAPVSGADTDGEASGSGHCRQLFGDVWEWTASPYVGYPGFRPVEGAVGEYNGKFMVDQQVLRGGCAVTPGGHVRATYRNFFPADARWAFSGLRLADDA